MRQPTLWKTLPDRFKPEVADNERFLLSRLRPVLSRSRVAADPRRTPPESPAPQRVAEANLNHRRTPPILQRNRVEHRDLVRCAFRRTDRRGSRRGGGGAGRRRVSARDAAAA